MKVKCIKRYSDICLKEVVEKGTVLEVTENRGAHLISEGVAEAVRETLSRLPVQLWESSRGHR